MICLYGPSISGLNLRLTKTLINYNLLYAQSASAPLKLCIDQHLFLPRTEWLLSLLNFLFKLTTFGGQLANQLLIMKYEREATRGNLHG
jgi:hypothetical protein